MLGTEEAVITVAVITMGVGVITTVAAVTTIMVVGAEFQLVYLSGGTMGPVIMPHLAILNAYAITMVVGYNNDVIKAFGIGSHILSHVYFVS